VTRRAAGADQTNAIRLAFSEHYCKETAPNREPEERREC
jgi:hypothetical protein